MKSLLLGIMFFVFASQNGVPNLSGRWLLDLDSSTTPPPVAGVNALVVSQSTDEVHFEYEGREGVVADERFETTWQRERRFSTRTQVGFARARWEKDRLVIETTVALNNEGTQSYSYTERWSVSPDGLMLTQTSSDGKTLVFHRAPMKKEGSQR